MASQAMVEIKCLACNNLIQNATESVKCNVCKNFAHNICVLNRPSPLTIKQINDPTEPISFNCTECCKIIDKGNHVVPKSLTEQLEKIHNHYQVIIENLIKRLNDNEIQIRSQSTMISQLSEQINQLQPVQNLISPDYGQILSEVIAVIRKNNDNIHQRSDLLANTVKSSQPLFQQRSTNTTTIISKDNSGFIECKTRQCENNRSHW